MDLSFWIILVGRKVQSSALLRNLLLSWQDMIYVLRPSPRTQREKYLSEPSVLSSVGSPRYEGNPISDHWPEPSFSSSARRF
jgi:hypothetical protein